MASSASVSIASGRRHAGGTHAVGVVRPEISASSPGRLSRRSSATHGLPYPTRVADHSQQRRPRLSGDQSQRQPGRRLSDAQTGRDPAVRGTRPAARRGGAPAFAAEPRDVDVAVEERRCRRPSVPALRERTGSGPRTRARRCRRTRRRSPGTSPVAATPHADAPRPAGRARSRRASPTTHAASASGLQPSGIAR